MLSGRGSTSAAAAGASDAQAAAKAYLNALRALGYD